MSILKDFKSFAVKGNMVDLAIGVIIGGAFGRIITSIVSDLIMPLMNPLMPQGHWREWTIGPGVKLGSFLSTVVDFMIVAIVIFAVVRLLHLQREQHAAKQKEEQTTTDRLLTEILDELRGLRGEVEPHDEGGTVRNSPH